MRVLPLKSTDVTWPERSVAICLRVSTVITDDFLNTDVITDLCRGTQKLLVASLTCWSTSLLIAVLLIYQLYI